MDQLTYDHVIFVPSKSSYILEEQKKEFCFSDEERLDMLYEIYAQNQPWMLFSDHDICSEEQPRTYETLKWFRDETSFQPTLLVGADQFYRMEEHWKNVKEIAEEFGIVVLTRAFFSLEAIMRSSDFYKKIAPHVKVVEAPQTTKNVSSSWIRHNLSDIEEGLRILKRDLTPEIYDYIKECYLNAT